MTLQECYDLWARCAYDGTFPSSRDGGCFYRADETPHCPRRCVAGVLIPDDKYSPDMEGGHVKGTEKEFFKSLLPEDMSIDDLFEAQRIHDWFIEIDNGCDWDASVFIRKINRLPCFQNVNRVHVTKESADEEDQ